MVLWRKNKTIQEKMARTMSNAFVLPKYFWVEVINTTYYVLNRIIIRHILKKTPYELYCEKSQKFLF